MTISDIEDLEYHIKKKEEERNKIFEELKRTHSKDPIIQKELLKIQLNSMLDNC